jgi:hypothetical protein
VVDGIGVTEERCQKMKKGWLNSFEKPGVHFVCRSPEARGVQLIIQSLPVHYNWAYKVRGGAPK